MGRSFPNDATHKYLVADPTGLGTVSAYTIVGLINPDSAARGAVMSLLSASTAKAQIIIDDVTTWYGAADFSGYSASPPVAGHWIMIGVSKAAGSSVYRWHFWDYTLAGATVHANGTGSHADPGTVDGIRLGDGDNAARGDAAVMGLWTRAISDAEFDSMATTSLADWAALDPDALWADDLETDLTGNGHDVTSTVGTVDTGTDPPGYDYDLLPPPEQAVSVTAGRPGERWHAGIAGGRWRMRRPDVRWQTGAPHA